MRTHGFSNEVPWVLNCELMGSQMWAHLAKMKEMDNLLKKMPYTRGLK